MASFTKTATCGAFVVCLGIYANAAFAGKHDEKVAQAAAESAASKIGDIRGSIDYPESETVVLKDTPANPSTLQYETPTPESNPEAEGKALPPLVNLYPFGIDPTTTAGIGKSGNKVVEELVWERYDHYGRRIPVR